jgi:hypothetical protein
MTKNKMPTNDNESATRVVSEEVFKQVYDSPRSLPGKQKWVTSDKDVGIIEKLLGMGIVPSVIAEQIGWILLLLVYPKSIEKK